MAQTDWFALVGFEARYQLRRSSFAVLTLALCGFSAVMVRTAYGAEGTVVNAPTAVMQSLGLLSLWALFTQTILTVHGVLRDVEHGMTGLIESRPISRGVLLLVRAGGVAGAGLVAFAIATAVLMIGPSLLVTDTARVGPVRLDAYVVPFLTLVVPNLLLVTALVIAVAAIWRSTVATYVGAVGLFAAYMLTALAVSSPIFAGGAPATPESLARAAILDPFGLSAFFEQSRYWTIAQREREIVSLTGRYLINRALWLTVALVVLIAAVRRLAVPSHRREVGLRPSRPELVRNAATTTRRSYRQVMPSATGFTAALASIWRMELRLLVASWPIRALMLGLIVVVTIELFQNLGAGEYGTRLLATSSELARRAGDPVAILGTLSLVYLAGEVMWRERSARMDQLVDATPRSGTVAVWGKLLALVTLAIVLVLLAQLVAIAVQLMVGGAALEWRVYAGHTLAVAWPLTLWAIMFGALHAITGQRWGGLLLGVVLLLISFTGSGLGFEHPMTRFPARPEIQWSDLDGFGPSLPSFTAFLSYWTVVAITVGIAASGVWPRGGVRSLVARIGSVTQPDARSWRRAMAATSMATMLVTPLLWKATWADGRWSSAESSLHARAGYERQFRRLAGAAQPDVQHADIRVELQPLAARARVSGSLRLVNRQALPVDTIWVFVDPETQVHRLTAGESAAIQPDARYSMHAIPLSRTLHPGDTVTLVYETSVDRTPISATGYDRTLTDNGSYLTTSDLIPGFGYRGQLEIADSATRARFALGAATPQLRQLDDTTLHMERRGWMTSRVVVATDSAQIPLATGEARRTWLEGARRLAEFTFDSATAPRVAVLSARYAVRRRTAGPVTVEVWYHPSHSENVDRILDAATTSLRVLGARFGRYPQPTLRIVELPSGWRFGGYAMPGTILLTENRGMRLDARSESVDLLLRRIGHEVAHQWWGGEVVPANVAGAGLIVEGLAKYSEQLIVAAVHGHHALAPMLAFDHDRYLVGRGRETGDERTLSATGYDDDYLFYGKAAIGFHALHAALGDSSMTRALRHFLHAGRGPDGVATTRSLRDALAVEAHTPAQQALLREWFDERVIHDVSIDSAVVDMVPGGHQVTVRGHAERITRQGMDEVVAPAAATEIEVRLAGGGSSVWTGRVTTERDGRFTVTITLAFRPTESFVDPDYHHIDPNRSNNRRRVSSGRGAQRSEQSTAAK